jgi:hypothetical protein
VPILCNVLPRVLPKLIMASAGHCFTDPTGRPAARRRSIHGRARAGSGPGPRGAALGHLPKLTCGSCDTCI